MLARHIRGAPVPHHLGRGTHTMSLQRQGQCLRASLPSHGKCALALRMMAPARRALCSSTSGSSSKMDRLASAKIVKDVHGTPFTLRRTAILPLSVVENPYVKAAAPRIGNMAYIIITSGFLMTDILMLRSLLIVGYSSLVTYHLLQTRPMRIPLRWSAFFVAVNVVYALRLALERWPQGLSEDDIVLYEASFAERLSRRQFKQLLDLGEHRDLRDGALVTREREACPTLFFVVRGHTVLKHEGQTIAKISRGGFINDVAFQQGEGSGAYGTVVCDGAVSVIAWDTYALREALVDNPSLDNCFRYVLVGSLIEQLLQRYKAQEEQALADKGNGDGKRLRALRTGIEGLRKLGQTDSRVFPAGLQPESEQHPLGSPRQEEEPHTDARLVKRSNNCSR